MEYRYQKRPRLKRIWIKLIKKTCLTICPFLQMMKMKWFSKILRLQKIAWQEIFILMTFQSQIYLMTNRIMETRIQPEFTSLTKIMYSKQTRIIFLKTHSTSMIMLIRCSELMKRTLSYTVGAWELEQLLTSRVKESRDVSFSCRGSSLSGTLLMIKLEVS